MTFLKRVTDTSFIPASPYQLHQLLYNYANVRVYNVSHDNRVVAEVKERNWVKEERYLFAV